MKNLIILALFLATNSLKAQGYEFTFYVKKCPSQLCQLGYYKGESTFIMDSVRMDSVAGKVTFKGKGKLHDGQYYFYISGIGMIDFIVNKEYKQTYYTHAYALLDSTTVEGSIENTAYLKYQKFNKLQQAEQQKFKQTLEIIRRGEKKKDDLKELEKNMVESNKVAKEFEAEFYATYPDLFITKVIRTKIVPQPPSTLSKLTYEGRPNIPYHVWLNRHYWDDFDFRDPKLVYTRVIPAKFSNFFEQYSSVRPDSIIQSFDRLMVLCQPNKELYRMGVEWMTKQAEIRKTGGSDNILVHLVDNYYKKDKSLADKATLSRLKKKADFYRPNLLNKTAPEFALLNTKDSLVVLSSVKNKYSVLYFYNTTDSVCKEKTPIVAEAMKTYLEKGVDIFAIATNMKKMDWKDQVGQIDFGWKNLFMDEKNKSLKSKYAITDLPVLYILDENKKIIGKNIKAEDLERLLKSAFSNPPK
ncbi:MAG: thioredoxin-like domain-containing protein [Saprospiraceae bacterium]